MIRMTIGVKGHKTFSRLISQKIQSVGDLTPIWKKVVHPFLIRHMRRQFETSGQYGGRAWEGYGAEPQYKAFKKETVGWLQLLRWTRGSERLYPSLVDPNHGDHIFEASQDSAKFGTSVPWAKPLTEGGIGPFGEPYPPRYIIRMTEDQRSSLVREMQREIFK